MYRPQKHREGCKGNCAFCQWLKRQKEEHDKIKKQEEIYFSWDESCVLI